MRPSECSDSLRVIFAAFEQLFAADYVDHTPFPGYGSDRESTRTIYLALRAAFPDLRATINRQFAEGDFVTTFKTYHGTHRGVFLGGLKSEVQHLTLCKVLPWKNEQRTFPVCRSSLRRWPVQWRCLGTGS